MTTLYILVLTLVDHVDAYDHLSLEEVLKLLKSFKFGGPEEQLTVDIYKEAYKESNLLYHWNGSSSAIDTIAIATKLNDSA